MSLRNTLAAGFKAQLSSQVVSAVVGGLIAVVLARLLEPSEYGLFFLAISVFSLVKVGTRLGIARSAGRYIAEYKESNPGQIPHIIRTAVAINLLTVSLAVVFLVVSHDAIAGLMNEPELGPLLLLGAAYVTFATFAVFLGKIWQGFEEIKLASTIEIVAQVGRLVFSIGFVLLGFGALGALGGYVLANVVTVVLGGAILYTNFYRVQAAAETVESGLRRRIVEYSIPITVTNTAQKTDKEIDTILIGFFLTPVAVSFYVVAKQVIRFLETPMNALGFTLSPTFGAQKAEGNLDRATRIYETALGHILLLYIPAGAGIILVADPFVALFFGSAYSGAVPVLQIFGVFAVLQAVTKLTGNGLDYLGRARSRAVARILTSILNVILNIILIPTIGVIGAALATVGTFGLYTAATLGIVATEFDIDWFRLGGEVVQITLITAAMSAVVLVLSGSITGPFTLFGVVGIGVAIWGVLSVATGLLDLQRIRAILA